MEIRLTHPTGRWLFFGSIILFAAILVIPAGRYWLAESWAGSSEPADWQRAAEIEPGNADYWYRLGRYRQLDFEHADLPLAIFYYRRAVGVDPRSANNWMALAGAYEMAGDAARARQAFESAEAAYPISSEVAWRYGNFLLRQDRLPEALPEIHRAVAADPKLAGLALSRCLRATGDVQRVLNQVLPAQVGAYYEALEFLVNERDLDPALAVWERLVKLHPPFEMRRALRLLDALINADRIEQAAHVWQQALQMAGWLSGATPGDSLVWDGGFERDFVNGGFGWWQLPVPGATFEFDRSIVHSGERSLRVTFDGSANLDFYHVHQMVPVKAGTRYHFSAYLRTDQITTNSGVLFWIYDPRHQGDLSLYSPNLVGSHPWTLQELEFTAGPRTQAVEIVLRRQPSEKFDNLIRGSVWVDDVSLAAVSQPGASPSP